jgi:7-carboxy-7-deazaguanine synthase
MIGNMPDLEKQYPVVEIFNSIQGEGIRLGTPCTFIRLAHCNLSCPWCDTDFSKFHMMSVKEILKFPFLKNIVFTGGEPMLQDLWDIAKSLYESDKKCIIAIETNGTLPTPKWINWVAASPKPQTNWYLNPECKASELKYVVDQEFTLEHISPKVREKFKGKIWLQPEGSEMHESWCKIDKMLKADPHPEDFRVGIQMHKFMGVQ